MRRRIMKCPKCKQIELKSYVINEIEVDQCPTCRGIWFDEQELPALLTHSSKDFKSLAQGKERSDLDKISGQCPVDDSDLMRVFSQPDRNVVIDRCPKCLGVWLDGGELKRLAK
jgi:Zn-finger nucleic acid-binding protein